MLPLGTRLQQRIKSDWSPPGAKAKPAGVDWRARVESYANGRDEALESSIEIYGYRDFLAWFRICLCRHAFKSSPRIGAADQVIGKSRSDVRLAEHGHDTAAVVLA